VDIGLERDAFLYVSDFMELEDADEMEEVPTHRSTQAQVYQPQFRTEDQPALTESQTPTEVTEPRITEEQGFRPAAENGERLSAGEARSSEPKDDRGGFRGRRRRGGRRGERFPDAKFARPAGERAREAPRPEPP